MLGIGEKEKRFMSNNITYTDEPNDISDALGRAEAVNDFLPAPEELVLKSEKERITIALDKRSLEAYKKYANKHDAKYQTMINGVLTSYADKFLIKK